MCRHLLLVLINVSDWCSAVPLCPDASITRSYVTKKLSQPHTETQLSSQINQNFLKLHCFVFVLFSLSSWHFSNTSSFGLKPWICSTVFLVTVLWKLFNVKVSLSARHSAVSLILQLRREKIDLENTLEQEQEALVNRLWKRMDKLEAEKRCRETLCSLSLAIFTVRNVKQWHKYSQLT